MVSLVVDWVKVLRMGLRRTSIKDTLRVERMATEPFVAYQ